ncbi:MAG: hydroxyacid dehydrogenase [Kiritimatiellia bacterium]
MVPKSLFILSKDRFGDIYGPDELTEIQAMTDLLSDQPMNRTEALENPALLAECEIIFSGWGGPKMDAAFLAAAPQLKAVFYGAGSVKGIISDAFWERGIVLTSSWGANAVPVAEFTLAQILFSLKQGWRHMRTTRETQRRSATLPVAGAYGSTVAIISLGMIGRMVCEHLQRFDLKVIAYDPFAKAVDAAALGARLCSLEDCFREADVVSLHAPWLPETENMITGAHFAIMKDGATFINTARGAIVDEAAMIAVLEKRPDLTVLLDVTYPEPPVVGSPLYALPNVFLTPHIAGSMGGECRRMGQYAINECRRFLSGESLHWQITRELAARMA